MMIYHQARLRIPKYTHELLSYSEGWLILKVCLWQTLTYIYGLNTHMESKHIGNTYNSNSRTSKRNYDCHKRK